MESIHSTEKQRWVLSTRSRSLRSLPTTLPACAKVHFRRVVGGAEALFHSELLLGARPPTLLLTWNFTSLGGLKILDFAADALCARRRRIAQQAHCRAAFSSKSRQVDRLSAMSPHNPYGPRGVQGSRPRGASLIGAVAPAGRSVGCGAARLTHPTALIPPPDRSAVRGSPSPRPSPARGRGRTGAALSFSLPRTSPA